MGRREQRIWLALTSVGRQGERVGCAEPVLGVFPADAAGWGRGLLGWWLVGVGDVSFLAVGRWLLGKQLCVLLPRYLLSEYGIL